MGDVTGRPSRVFAAVYRIVTRIPRARLVTYGQVARMAGIPGAARTVGWALGALADGGRHGGRLVPWHRVINASGRVSARGGDGSASRRQILRLEREGIRPRADGSYDLQRHGWDGRAVSSRPRGAAGHSTSPAGRPNRSSASRPL